MVKERRAFEVRSISDTLPSKSPAVTDAPVRDFSSEIEATQYSTGMNILPSALKTMSELTNDVVDLYRTKEFYNRAEEISWDAAMVKEKQRQFEVNTKREQDSIAFEHKQDIDAEMIDAYQNAKRTGGNVFEAVQGVYNKSEKTSESLHTQSPYIADQYDVYRRQLLQKYTPNAIEADYTNRQVQAESQIESALGTEIFKMSSGIYNEPITKNNVSNIIGAPVAEAVHGYVGKAYPLLDHVNDTEDFQKLNAGYQRIILRRAAEISEAVKNGTLSITEGRDALYTLGATYNTFKTEVVDSEGNAVSVELYLNPDTYKTIFDTVGNLKNTTSKVAAINNHKQYKERISGGANKFTDFADNRALRGLTYANAYVEYNNTQKALEDQIAAGNSKAFDAYKDNARLYYTEVRPVAFIKQLLSMSMGQGKSYGEAIQGIEIYLNNLQKRINNPADTLDDVNDLGKYDPEKGVSFTYTIPEKEADKYFDDVFREDGSDERTVRAIFYQAAVTTGREFLEYAKKPGAILNMDEDMGGYQDSLLVQYNIDSALSTDPSTGITEINQENAALAGAFMGQIDSYAEAADIPSASAVTHENIIKKGTKEVEGRDAYTKAKYQEYVALSLMLGKNIHHLSFFENGNMTNDELAFRDGTASVTYLKQAPGGGSYLSRINEAHKDTKFNALVDKEDIDSYMSGRVDGGSGKFSERVEKLINDRNIPKEHRPALRYTAKRMALVTVYDNPEADFNMKDFEKLLEGSYTSKGNYRASKAFQKQSVEQYERYLERAYDASRAGLKRAGVDKSIDAKIDYKNGDIVFVHKDDGFPIMAQGRYSGLPGANKVPIRIQVKYEDVSENMSEAQYLQGLDTLIGIMLPAIALMQPGESDELQDIKKNRKINSTHEQDMQHGNTILSALADKNVQIGAIQYLAMSPKKREQVTVQAAPSTMVDLVVGLKVRRDEDVVGKIPGGNLIGEVVDSILDRDKVGRGRNVLDERLNPVEANNYRLLLNYAYSSASVGNKMGTVVPTDLDAQAKGFPVVRIENKVKDMKYWKITSTTDGIHAEGPRSHKTGYKMDVGGVNGWFGTLVGSDGRLISDRFDEMGEGLIIPEAKAGNLRRIFTGNKELVDGMSSDPAFKKYRDLTNKDGSKVFVYDPSGEHDDHLDFEFYNQQFDPETGKEIKVSSSEFVYRTTETSKKNLPSLAMSDKERMAVSTFCWKRPATDEDAKRVGISKEVINSSPTLMAQTQMAKYDALCSVTGDKSIAAAALLHPDATFAIVANKSRSSIEEWRERAIFSAPETTMQYLTPPWSIGVGILKQGSETIQRKYSNRKFTGDELLKDNVLAGIGTGAYKVIMDPDMSNNKKNKIREDVKRFNNIADITGYTESDIPKIIWDYAKSTAGFYADEVKDKVNTVKDKVHAVKEGVNKLKNGR